MSKAFFLGCTTPEQDEALLRSIEALKILETEPTVGPWNVSRAEYHADRTCTCNSALQDLRESVGLYHGRYIAGTIPPREETDAMRLGTAVHHAVLEPAKFLAEVHATPMDIDRRTKAGRWAYSDFLERSAGGILLDTDDYGRALAMRDAVMRHSKACAALELPGPVEQAIRWRDESGLWVRNLIDKVVTSANMRLIVDLKTTSGAPAEFARSIAKWGYHLQAELYSHGAVEAFGWSECAFMFIVVSTQPPHEVACFVLDTPAIELAARVNRATLDDLARRQQSGDWSSRHAGLVETVSLPRWAMVEEA